MEGQEVSLLPFLRVKEDNMYQVGIDIGSSAAKAAVINEGEVIKTILLAAGKWRMKSMPH